MQYTTQLGSQNNLHGQIMHKRVEDFLISIRTWFHCAVSLLVAIVIAGCGGGKSAHPHVPKEIGRLSPQQKATEQHESTGEDANHSEALKTSESVAGKVDQYERLSRLHILLLQKSQALLDSIVDEVTAEKAAASWYSLFPIQVDVEYLEGRLVDFTELNDQRSKARKKYGSHIEKSRQQLLERQGECKKLPYFDKVNKAQLEYSEDLLSVTPLEIQNGHAWQANGPQFVLWFPPGAIPEIDLSHEKGTLEVLIVEEETGALRLQREPIQCGGTVVLPDPDDKRGRLYWLRPVQSPDEETHSGENELDR